MNLIPLHGIMDSHWEHPLDATPGGSATMHTLRVLQAKTAATKGIRNDVRTTSRNVLPSPDGGPPIPHGLATVATDGTPKLFSPPSLFGGTC